MVNFTRFVSNPSVENEQPVEPVPIVVEPVVDVPLEKPKPPVVTVRKPRAKTTNE